MRVTWAKPEDAQRWQREFGERVRTLREKQKMSQMTLAETAGLHFTYVSSVERGRRNISLVNVHALAAALKVPVRDLFV